MVRRRSPIVPLFWRKGVPRTAIHLCLSLSVFFCPLIAWTVDASDPCVFCLAPKKTVRAPLVFCAARAMPNLCLFFCFIAREKEERRESTHTREKVHQRQQLTDCLVRLA
nr:hypothetical protein [Pandoravirus aubagnensis]